MPFVVASFQEEIYTQRLSVVLVREKILLREVFLGYKKGTTGQDMPTKILEIANVRQLRRTNPYLRLCAKSSIKSSSVNSGASI